MQGTESATRPRRRGVVALVALAVVVAAAGALIITLTPPPSAPRCGSGGTPAIPDSLRIPDSPIEIELTTRQWRFDVVRIIPEGAAIGSSVPSTGPTGETRIVVPQGATIVLHIRNLDVPHGLALEEFGVNVVTPPDEVTTVTFVASQVGSFCFFCTVFCGPGHPNHVGTLVVVG